MPTGDCTGVRKAGCGNDGRACRLRFTDGKPFLRLDSLLFEILPDLLGTLPVRGGPVFYQSPISRSMTYISSFSKFCSLTQAAWNS